MSEAQDDINVRGAYPHYPERIYSTLPKRIQVDKRTHRIRFENETERTVIVVIEPKNDSTP